MCALTHTFCALKNSSSTRRWNNTLACGIASTATHTATIQNHALVRNRRSGAVVMAREQMAAATSIAGMRGSVRRGPHAIHPNGEYHCARPPTSTTSNAAMIGPAATGQLNRRVDSARDTDTPATNAMITTADVQYQKRPPLGDAHNPPNNRTTVWRSGTRNRLRV